MNVLLNEWWPLTQAFMDAAACLIFLGSYYMVYRWWAR